MQPGSGRAILARAGERRPQWHPFVHGSDGFILGSHHSHKDAVFHLLYGGRYDTVSNLIPAIAVGSVLWSGTIGASIALRAMESRIQSSRHMRSQLSIRGCGNTLKSSTGVTGAVWAMNLSDGVALGMIVILLKSRLKRNTAPLGN